MLAGNDVIGLMRLPSIFFMEQTILAPMPGSTLHPRAEDKGEVLAHNGTARRVRNLALTDCIRISRCSN